MHRNSNLKFDNGVPSLGPCRKLKNKNKPVKLNRTLPMHVFNIMQQAELKPDQWSIQNKQNKTAVLAKSDFKPDMPPPVPKA